MIEMQGLCKDFGSRRVVSDVSARVEGGYITGFVGPNGAGKSTTMKMLVGLTRPTGGQALIDGRSYGDLVAPTRVVGLALETHVCHPGRRIRDHLRYLAVANDIDRSRVDEVLGLVDLSEASSMRGKALSLGMAQRLALAVALLGDPAVLVLDEPMNGLDPAGMVWLRGLLRSLALEGRTVLISSHLMTEMSMWADHLLVLVSGKLVCDAPVSELLARFDARVEVRTSEAARLVAGLEGSAVACSIDGDLVTFEGTSVDQVTALAAREDISVTAVRPVDVSLEEAFLALTETAATKGAR